MAEKKKYDPFKEFSENIVNSPTISESIASQFSPTPADVQPEQEVTAPVSAGRGRPKTLTDDVKAFTFYIKKEFHDQLKLARFKSGLSYTDIINSALEDYLKRHPELFR